MALIDALTFENGIECLTLSDNSISRIYESLLKVKQNIEIYLNENMLPEQEVNYIQNNIGEYDSLDDSSNTGPYVECVGNKPCIYDKMQLDYTHLSGDSSS